METPRGLTALVPAADRRTLVMGVLNITPDSFSDGGQFLDPAAAVAQARQMMADGADIIDIGGESTRPGADPVPAAEEMRRILPVIRSLREAGLGPISVDTYKAEVAAAAVDAGAVIINDIGGLTLDPDVATVAARTGAYLVVMHLRGTPRTMQQHTDYDDVVAEVIAFLRRQLQRAQEAGVPPDHLIADPGIGISFGKTASQNLEILRRLSEFAVLQVPILVGTSRKGFIGRVLGLPVDQRLEGTAATVAAAILHGAAIVRVHDVLPMVRVARMTDAILGRWQPEE